MKLFRDSFTEEGRRQLSYRRVDYLIETYFRAVKDLSHVLFHTSERGTYQRLLQVTFDMAFGMVFHVLLKYKETQRLSENYNIDRFGRIVDRLRRSADGEISGIPHLFERLRLSYERDLEAAQEELSRAREALDEIEEIFARILAVYADNGVIMRTLHSNHAFFLKLFPKEGVDRIFRRMYPGVGAAQAYIVLGFDYLRSGHLDLADRAFRRALRRKEIAGKGIGADLAAIYRRRRRLFVAGDPNTDPAALRRLTAVQRFEANHHIGEDAFRP